MKRLVNHPEKSYYVCISKRNTQTNGNIIMNAKTLSNEIKIVALFGYSPTRDNKNKFTTICFVDQNDERSSNVEIEMAKYHIENGGEFSSNVEITEMEMIWSGSDCVVITIDGKQYVMFNDHLAIEI